MTLCDAGPMQRRDNEHNGFPFTRASSEHTIPKQEGSCVHVGHSPISIFPFFLFSLIVHYVKHNERNYEFEAIVTKK